VENLTGSNFNDLLAGNELANKLEGGLGNDTLYGGIGNDSLAGGFGNDVLNGQSGADVFAFVSGSGGDKIADFNAIQGDKIQLEIGINASGIVDGASALAATVDVGANAVINLGGGHTITLIGVLAASLTASDFTF
jgi:serralysin